MLTAKQITWASQHDWFINYSIVDITDDGAIGRITVREDDGEATWIGTFKALKDWAGY